MTQQTHATRQDIEAILAARRQATIEQAVTVHTIPAMPQQPAARLQPQSVPLTQPAAVPALTPAPEPQLSDEEVTAFLQAHLTALIGAAKDLVTPPFAWAEVIRLGEVVSEAVQKGLPHLKGAEARALVVVVVRYLWRTYATPLLPVYARPFAGLLETLIVTGIEAAYQLAVKRRE